MGRRQTTRRWIAAALPVVLAIGMIGGPATDPAAAADGPSVELPKTSSTPVSEQKMDSRGEDAASKNALKGDQKASASPIKEGGGTYAATPLAPSASWQVSPHTGDFTWSYPLRVPPAPGGLEPKLALSYASSAVDGRTSSTNAQASWVGDGWDLSPGFIERSYGACAEDTSGSNTKPPKVGDLCWRSDNATASFSGGGGMLIKDDKTGEWRTRSDDGSRIERLNNAGNGARDGEHWKITTVDGTQYFFGSQPGSKSTWTVPVYGDDSGEPCHDDGGFDKSSCTQAWRWNLDKVIDRNGNVMVYTYRTETNSYGQNGKDAAVSYIRGGTLERVEYGMRDGQPASGRVAFDVADRCVPGSNCAPDKTENWPDVPWDEKCDTATCKDEHAPTFWSTKRLAKVTTQVRRGGDYTDVDSWELNHQFPDPGDGEKATLWLKEITHTGHVGGKDVALSPVTFEGTPLGNRVDKVDGIAPLVRYRVSGVVSESGGVTSVHYADPDCSAESLPDKPETNTKRCYPVTWQKKDYAERTDYFHKYVVARVTESDRIGANTEQITSYEYLDGAAWHYDTSEFAKDDKRTWDEFRGYGRVRIRKGKDNDSGGPVTMTEQRFYRGMDGDKLPGSDVRHVKVTDSQKRERQDDDWLHGFAFESITFDGENDQKIVAKSITDPSSQGPIATRGQYKAYIVRPGSVDTYTALEAGGWQTTRRETSYDNRGLPTKANDLGDTATDRDDRCTEITYARNTTAWLLGKPATITTVAKKCGTAPDLPDDAVSATRYSYDGQDPDKPPTAGNVTRTEQAKKWTDKDHPDYVTASTAAYDAHGRVTETGDALGRKTRTAFTPETGGPLTKTVVTDPAGFSSTNTVEPAWGTATKVVDANDRVTEIALDALGRNQEVWLPNRPREDFDHGNLRFDYQIRNDGPSVSTTTKLGPNGNYTSVKELYDGLLRLRQTQTPAAGGGRLLTDVRYDSQGRAFKSTNSYFNNGDVDDKLWVGSDTEVPGLTVTRFDGAGRAVAQIFKGGGEEKWRTTTAYGGDRVHVTPPRGGIATTTITDARGQTMELRQYHDGKPTGDYDATTYSYDNMGHLAATTDSGGSTWRYSYDLLGNRTKVEDPDRGTSTLTYDAAGQLATNTDARGTKLIYSYDGLGRKTRIRRDSDSGPTLDTWSYDTADDGKGMLASTTRYVGDAAYTSKVEGYSPLYRPLGTTVTIPETEQTLAGTYTTWAKYNPDGSAYGKTLPATGDLAKETLHQTYDDLGHLQATTGGISNGTSTYVAKSDYTSYGEVARLTLGAGTRRAWLSYYYDDYTRRVDRSIVDAEVPLPMQNDVHYDYDDAGNVTSIADTAKNKPHDVQCFRYDYLRRLDQAWTPAETDQTGGPCAADPRADALAGPAPYWHSFTFDRSGNRKTETQHATGGDTVREYTYPSPGQADARRLTAVHTRGPGGVDKQDTFGYDDTGNTIERKLAGGGAQKLDWDAEGHLVKATKDGKTTEFVTTPDGQRLIRRDPQGSTLYLDGQELHLDASGKLTATRYYEHGGQTVAMRTSAGVTWLASDHHGTADIAIDEKTQKATQRRSTPFGAARGPAAVFPGEKGFVGGTIDASTGLTHLGARDYDPATGRFISVDPLIGHSGSQQSNGYAYSNNNPITYSDASGLSWFSDAVDWVGEQSSRVVEHIKDDPLKFLGEVAVGVAVGIAIAGVCATGVGCAIAAGIAGGMASGAYGYGSDVINHKVEPSWEGFSDTVTSGGIAGGIGGVLFGGTAAILGRSAPKGSLTEQFIPKNVRGPWSLWDGPVAQKALTDANKLRDDLMDEALRTGNIPIKKTFTAGMDPRTGRMAAAPSGKAGGLPDCAECNVADALELPMDQVLYTKAYFWQEVSDGTVAGAVKSGQGKWYVRQEKEICTTCQGRTNREQYPRGTQTATGGAWSGGTGGYRELGGGNYTTSDGRLCNHGGGRCAI